MVKSIIILIVLAVVFYILYINGYMVFNAKKASSYVGSNRDKSARFSSCSGYIKRVVSFKEDHTYHFELSAQLEKGDMTIELLDAEKNTALCLTSEQNRASIDLSNDSRYCLVYRFKGATGSFDLKWD